MKLFVYGTLKVGYYWHKKYMSSAVLLGPAVTSNEFGLYIDGLPHMIAEKSDNGVKGELFEIDQDTLNALDGLEGHPLIYKREVIEVILKDGGKTTAWAYLRPKEFKGKINAFKEDEFI